MRKRQLGRDVQVLFITWDGPGSTYLEGLFLPIFKAMSSRGFKFHVLQFTWAKGDERCKLRETCAAAGVSYRSASIWRRPIALGSLATALWGRGHVRRATRDLSIDLLMPRSTISALATIPILARTPVLLDADGLPNDERVEFQGASRNGISYRILRSLEAWSVRRADIVTVRSDAAVGILSKRAGIGRSKFRIVANARDEGLFQPLQVGSRAARRSEVGIGDAPLVVYAGSSLTGKYLGDAMLDFFGEVRSRRDDARFLFLMPSLTEARALLGENQELAGACLLQSAAPNEVPDWLALGDLGLALIQPSFSMQAASAIKIGEYLLCGMPVLATAGVGESERVASRGVGLCIRDVSRHSLGAAADWFVRDVLPNREKFRTRCRKEGVKQFSLDAAVGAYEDALRSAFPPIQPSSDAGR